MRSIVFALLVAGFLPLSSAGESVSDVAVIVSRRGFDPPVVEANRGTTIEFHRRDRDPGTYRIVSADGSIESRAFEQYTQWSHRFDEAGAYELFIQEHPETTVQILIR